MKTLLTWLVVGGIAVMVSGCSQKEEGGAEAGSSIKEMSKENPTASNELPAAPKDHPAH